MNSKQRIMITRIIATFILTVSLCFVETGNRYIQFVLFMIPYLIVGYDILLKAIKNIRKGQIFDENFLMAVASIGAFMLAFLEPSGRGDYKEAVAVILFYQIGEFFEGYIVAKSRKSIGELVDLTSDSVSIEEDGKVIQTDPDSVKLGSIIVVKPGERVPIDGVIISGQSSIDTSAITGESLPRSANIGDEVLSGAININCVLRIRTTKLYEDSTATRILEMVENSVSRKASSEKFISKFAKYYTPVVCYSALAVALLPPLFRMLVMSASPDWSEWVYRALTFLVISCPCALVVSIPLTFFAAMGGSSRQGILVKGSNFLEKLAKTKCVLMDKTGTLTCGKFAVSGIFTNNFDSKELLRLAAYAESSSSHPIAAGIVSAYEKSVDRSLIESIEEISGQGVKAIIDGKTVLVGNTRLLKANEVDASRVQASRMAGTVVHVAVNSVYVGTVEIADQIKDTSRSAIDWLKKIGMRSIVMLTGDSDKVAAYVGEQLAISDVHSSLLPTDKVKLAQDYSAKIKKDSKDAGMVFVGDGLNDAPVLASADVGIAMGGIGSDAAIEAADVIIMDDDPLKIANAVIIAKKCMSITWQNIFFALGVKILCMILGTLGFASLWLAIFADVGVLILVVLNAVRAMFTSKLK